MTPYDLVLSRPPQIGGYLNICIENMESVEHGSLPPWQARRRLSTTLRTLMETASACLRKAQARYEADFDRHVRPVNYRLKKCDHVYLRREDGRPGESEQKFRSKAIGPFEVVSIKPNDRTVVMARDGDRDTVSYYPIVPAPMPRTDEDKQEQSLVPRPTGEEFVPSDDDNNADLNGQGREPPRSTRVLRAAGNANPRAEHSSLY